MMTKLIAFLTLTVSAFAQHAPCVTIEGDQIRGSDLARVIPAFQRIPPATLLAPIPGPGGTRVFTATELQSIATRFSVNGFLVNNGAIEETCFQMLTEPLDRQRVLEAMQVSLKSPDVHIELVEVSSGKVPAGRLEFPREGLGAPALADRKSPVLWRGEVVYGTGAQRFPVWGRVNVTAPVDRIVATETLKAGVAIQSSQLRRETVEMFPVSKPLPDPEKLVGMLPIRTIPAGGEIQVDNLAHPIDVHRGDRVRVEVRMGATHLALNGMAEANGRIGDVIPVRNPDSSKMFRARVESRDKVIVELAGSGGQ